MKMIEIKDLTDKQLREKIAEEDLNLTKMRLSHHVSSLENPMKIGATRKTIARLKTEMRKRELAQTQASK